MAPRYTTLSGSTGTYKYDADNRRVQKQVTGSGASNTVYIYAGPNCIAEYNFGAAATSPGNEYVYAQGIDSLVMLATNNNASQYAATRNQQWSVTALTDLNNGTVQERYTYDHFGNRTILASNGVTVRTSSNYNMPYGYTSRRHDSESGLMYFQARFYDPTTGEFTSRDPYEYVDGMSMMRGYMGLVKLDPNGLNCKTKYYSRAKTRADIVGAPYEIALHEVKICVESSCFVTEPTRWCPSFCLGTYSVVAEIKTSVTAPRNLVMTGLISKSFIADPDPFVVFPTIRVDVWNWISSGKVGNNVPCRKNYAETIYYTLMTGEFFNPGGYKSDIRVSPKNCGESFGIDFNLALIDPDTPGTRDANIIELSGPNDPARPPHERRER